MEYNKKRVIRYLVWTFLIAWIIQGVASWCFYHVGTAAFQALLIVTMFAPLVGVLLSGYSLKGMGWIPPAERKSTVLSYGMVPSGNIDLRRRGCLFPDFPRTF